METLFFQKILLKVLIGVENWIILEKENLINYGIILELIIKSSFY